MVDNIVIPTSSVQEDPHRSIDAHPREGTIIEIDTGKVCPACHKGKFELDGCLNRVCPVCGFTESGGGFT